MRPRRIRQQWLHRWRFMEKAGDRWWLMLGAVYLLTAVKRVRGMRLIGAVWKGRARNGQGVLAPVSTTRMALTPDARSAVINLQPMRRRTKKPERSPHPERPMRSMRKLALADASESIDRLGTQVEIWTDGACKGNPGPGGWGALLKYGERARDPRWQGS